MLEFDNLYTHYEQLIYYVIIRILKLKVNLKNAFLLVDARTLASQFEDRANSLRSLTELRPPPSGWSFTVVWNKLWIYLVYLGLFLETRAGKITDHRRLLSLVYNLFISDLLSTCPYKTRNKCFSRAQHETNNSRVLLFVFKTRAFSIVRTLRNSSLQNLLPISHTNDLNPFMSSRLLKER